MEALQTLALQTMSVRTARSSWKNILLIVFIVIVSIIFVVILCKIFSAIGLKYAGKNKEKILKVDPKFFTKLKSTGKVIAEQNKTYNALLTVYGLDRTIRCSNSVVANAANDPLKYVLKYTTIDNDVDDLERLEFLKSFLQLHDIFLEKMDEARHKALNELPLFHRVFVSRKKLPYVVCDIDYELSKITTAYLRFLYVSPAGRVQRNHKIEIDKRLVEHLISEVSKNINSKNHKKTQRSAMTNDLREAIKKRDNYTCCKCGNSVFKEPNLLLEVDHIVPISKGGKTEADNLQTLCWRCNRAKGDKDNDNL